MVECDASPGGRSPLSSSSVAKAGPSDTILLKADTQIELGPPGKASCAMVLPTSDSTRVVDGRVTRIGKDFPELSGGHDFAIVVLAAGRSLDEPDCAEMFRALVAVNQIEGFMARSTEGRLWCRVGRKACAQGLNVHRVACAIYDLIRHRVPAVEAVEILWVISVSSVVRELEATREQWHKIERTMKRYRRVDAESYECESNLDCNECPDLSVCDTIREIIVIRRGRKEVELKLSGRRKT